MKICEDAWEEFVLYANVIMNSRKATNEWRRPTKAKGNTVFGNRQADIFDVFNFWREDILGGQPYPQHYMDNLVQRAIEEEAYGL